ncbi:MAG: replicative DNA helicase [Candidatus Babeliaceae bacterium]
MHNKSATGKPEFATVEKLIGKALPSSLEAERSVLGTLLLNDEHVETVAQVLVPRDFYSPAHQIIFHVIIELVGQKKRIDLITLHDELEKRGTLTTLGGMAYLVSLQEDMPSIGLLEQHAHLIKEKSLLRELINCAAKVIGNCYTQKDMLVEQILDEAEKSIFTISRQRESQNFVQLTIWLKRAFAHLSELKAHNKGITGIAAGYKKLDEMTAGFQKGDLNILAARPSMGKTALALSIARYAAQEGHVVGFFSLEMSAEQLTFRLLAMQSQVTHHVIRNGMINSDEWIDLTHAAGKLAEMKIFIDDTALQTVMEIRAKARKLKMDYGLDFLVIDYLQLIQGMKKHENRHQEVSEISRSLKALAKELGIPILALSQLSRAVDSRVDKRPMLSDLRESGAIEQDADLILFLYRDVVYNADAEDPASTELIIGKQRNGPTGVVYLNYQKELMLFEEYEQ